MVASENVHDPGELGNPRADIVTLIKRTGILSMSHPCKGIGDVSWKVKRCGDVSDQCATRTALEWLKRYAALRPRIPLRTCRGAQRRSLEFWSSVGH